MFELKALSKNAVAGALARAERYRFLNQPMQAASICEDVLRVEPNRHDALVTLLLALTEQFAGPEAPAVLSQARGLVPRLPSEYERAYYSGIICERRAWTLLASNAVGSGASVYEWLREAMDWFERAEAQRPPDNDDAILRWNACARLLMRNPRLQRREEERDLPLVLE